MVINQLKNYHKSKEENKTTEKQWARENESESGWVKLKCKQKLWANKIKALHHNLKNRKQAKYRRLIYAYTHTQKVNK